MADSKLVEVTLIVNGLNLTEGKDHKVSVTATNSIGTSQPVTGILSLAGEFVSDHQDCASLPCIWSGKITK